LKNKLSKFSTRATYGLLTDENSFRRNKMIKQIINDYKNLDSTAKEMVNVSSAFGIALVVGIILDVLTKI